MAALRPTEFRIASDRQSQIKLERLLAAHQAQIAAREARYLKLRTPSMQAVETPTPEPFSWVDGAWFLAPMMIVASLLLVANWAGWLA